MKPRSRNDAIVGLTRIEVSSAPASRSSSTARHGSSGDRMIWSLLDAPAALSVMTPAAWSAITPAAEAVGDEARSRTLCARAFRTASAARAARLGASSTGGTPKAARKPEEATSTSRPPNPSIFSMRISIAAGSTPSRLACKSVTVRCSRRTAGGGGDGASFAAAPLAPGRPAGARKRRHALAPIGTWPCGAGASCGGSRTPPGRPGPRSSP